MRNTCHWLTDSGAEVSADGKYRYLLWREWKTSEFRRSARVAGSTCLFVMLNPSTADARENDPTIRRCMGFAQDMGHNRLEVVNLFAYRATDPQELLDVGVASTIIGAQNDRNIMRAAERASVIVCAWGTKGWIADRAKTVRAMLSNYELYALGFTQGGHPKHPLYVAKGTKLERLSDK